MKIKNLFRVLSVIAILVIGVLFVSRTSAVSSAADAREGPGGRDGNGQRISQPGTGYALTLLSCEEITALQQAILEEYGAFKLYQSAIDQVGNGYPFSQIVRAEQQHINALTHQVDKYGAAVPANPGLATKLTFNTFAQACLAAEDLLGAVPLMEAEPALELVEWVAQASVADRIAVVPDQAAPADLADGLRTLSSI